MKLLKNIKSLLNQNTSKADLNKMNEWKSEAESTLSNLQKLNGFENAIENMAGYKNFDTKSAYQKITGETFEENNVRSINWKAITSAAAIVLLISVFVLKNNTQQEFKSETIAASLTKEFQLIDKSIVTLDDASKLTTLSSRKVKLDGRAFFKVQSTPSKDKFVIEMHKGQVTVLGTQFSINTDNDYNEINVIEGKVRYDFNGQSVLLTAGQSAALINDQIIKSESKPNAFSWKNQSLEFKDTPLNEALEDIGKHYNVSFILENNLKVKPTCLLTTKIQKETIDQMLSELKSLFNISYTRKGSKVMITAIKC